MDYIVGKMELNRILKNLDKISETAFKLDNESDTANEKRIQSAVETILKEQWKARIAVYNILETAYAPLGKNKRYLVKGDKKLIPIEYVENAKVAYKTGKYEDALVNLRTCFEILYEANPDKEVISQCLSEIDYCLSHDQTEKDVKNFIKLFSSLRKDCGVLIITELNGKNKNK